MNDDDWHKLLRKGAAILGLHISSAQLLCFHHHMTEMLYWNRKINLTAITNPEDIAIKHFLDAIAPVDRIPPGGRILDVGTGAGFPGIPIKILRPKDPMTLLDSSRKKINFIRHLIRQLDLKQVDARQSRIEAFVREFAPTTHFEVIVSRAVTNVARLTHLVMPLLRSGAALWLWKGHDIEEELRALNDVPEVRQGILKVHVHPYQLPIVDVGRNLINVACNASSVDCASPGNAAYATPL